MSNGYDPRISSLKWNLGLGRDLKAAKEQFGRSQQRLSDYEGKKSFMTGLASKGFGLGASLLGSHLGIPPELARSAGTFAGGLLMDKYGNKLYGDAPEVGKGTFGLFQDDYSDLAEFSEGIDPRITSAYQGTAFGQGLAGLQGLDWGALGAMGAQEGKYISPSYKSSLGFNTPSFGNLQQSLLSLLDKSSDMVQKREPKSYDFSSPDFSESDLQELLQRNPNIKFTPNKEVSKSLPEIDMNSVLNKVQERQEGMLGDLQLNELEFDDYSNLPDAPPPSQPMQSLPPVDVMADNTTKWGERNPETGERVGGINPSLLNLFSGGKEAASSLFGNIADFASSPYEESGDASSILSLLGMQQGGSPMQMPGVSKPIPYQKGGNLPKPQEADTSAEDQEWMVLLDYLHSDGVRSQNKLDELNAREREKKRKKLKSILKDIQEKNTKLAPYQQGGAIQQYNLGGEISQQPMSYQLGGLLKYKRSPMG